MALSKAGLSSAIKSELDALAPTDTADSGADGDAWRQDFCDALAEAIVNHIQASATVATTTSCPAGAGTGTGSVS